MMAKAPEIVCKKRANPSFLGLICLFVLTAVCFSNAHAAEHYVDAGVPVSGDGTSWAQAFGTIQEAVVASVGGDEIWVKEGNYALSAEISVDKALSIYGGFNGTESQRDERDWAMNVTAVDGQNSVRCFNINGGAGADFTLDGFTINNGNDSTGGGLYNNATPVTIANCIFLQNMATQSGGAVYNLNASCTFSNCVFLKNESTNYGGGIFNIAGTPTSQSSCVIINCTFFQNEVTNYYGGGVCNWGTQALATITNSILHGDIAGSAFPEVADVSGSSSDVTYCNIHQYGYGGTNINLDPQYVDVSDPNPSFWDLRLQSGSPCIDAGTDTVADPPGLSVVDLDSHVRIWDGDGDTVEIIDMGAYEYGAPAPSAPDISVSPAGLDFGGIALGGVSTQETITIANVGNSDLTITAITVSDDTNYSMIASPTPIILNPGEDTDVFVTFMPVSVGQIDATISVDSNDPDELSLDIPLTGIGRPTLTMAVNGSGSTSPAVGSYEYDVGDVVNISATAAIGWQFENWSGGVADQNAASTTVTMDGVKTVTANFSQFMYLLTIAVNGNGSTSPAVGSYDYAEGSVVNVTATANTGYHFTGWSGSASGSSNPLTVTVNSDMNITANFAFNTYIITATADDHGSISPSGTVSVDHGSSETFTITANELYAIRDVLVDGSSVGSVANYTFENVTRNHTIEAIFGRDVDGDGISDEEEDGHPNGGDGNNDGKADKGQSHVTSMRAWNGTYICLESDGAPLVDVAAVGNPSPDNSPEDVEFPLGFFEFTLQNVGMGGSAIVTLYLPDGEAPTTYYKFGPEPGKPTPHWYEFLYDGETGAEIKGDVVILHFVDGERGDDSPYSDGEITDIGAPGEKIVRVEKDDPAGGDGGGGGGGGGCFIGTAGHSSLAGPIGWFLIAGAITWWLACCFAKKTTA